MPAQAILNKNAHDSNKSQRRLSSSGIKHRRIFPHYKKELLERSPSQLIGNNIMTLTEQQKRDLVIQLFKKRPAANSLSDYYLRVITGKKSDQLGDIFSNNGESGNSSGRGDIDTSNASGNPNKLAANVAGRAARALTGRALADTRIGDMPVLPGVASRLAGDIISGKPSSQVRQNAGVGAGMSVIREGLNAIGVPGYAGSPVMAAINAGLTTKGTNSQVGRASVDGFIKNAGGLLSALLGGTLLGVPGAIGAGMLGRGVVSNSFRNGFLGDALDAREYEAYRDSLEDKYSYDYAKKMVDGFPSMPPSASLTAMEDELGPDLGDMGEPGFFDGIGDFFNAIQDALGMGDHDDTQQDPLAIYEGHNDFLGGRDPYWSGGDGQGGHGPDGADVRASHDRGDDSDNDGGHGADGTN